MFDQIITGFQVALSPDNLFYCFGGVFLGTFIGVLPGVGALAALSLLLPVTYYLEPVSAIIMLAGVFYGAEYGGSISSILLNLPGTTSSAVVCLDGHPMAKNKKAGVALFITAISSFLGGTVGVILLMIATPLFVAVALGFSAPEYFAVMVLGLVAAAAISKGSQVKGLAMVLFGLGLGTIGMDMNTGAYRYTFGINELYDGISIVALAMGLFGVSEIIMSIRGKADDSNKNRIKVDKMIPSRSEAKQCISPIGRGSLVGSFFGALPGTGATVASFISYSIEKKISKHPEKFGKGAIEGIAGPESSNNAAAQTSFIPTLALGIPGTASMAIILGAFLIHGITPGPSLVTNEPELFWGLIASFWIGNLFLLILNIPLIKIWVFLLKIPYIFLYPSVIALICVGVYSLNRSVFDILMVFGFGILGYVLRIYRFEPATLLLGFVLGPLMEENFRRAMIISRGDFSIFFTRPVSAVVLMISISLVVWSFYRLFKKPDFASGRINKHQDKGWRPKI